MILNANALHIPLADKSVQCVVTSPPYYGLRDYGTARWQGGDPECDHKIPDVEHGNLIGKSNGKDRQNSHTVRFNRKNCYKCGAVRIDNQLGLEQTPDEYIAKMVSVFREVWRVLRDDGTLWLNIGDSYATHANKSSGQFGNDIKAGFDDVFTGDAGKKGAKAIGLKEKDLIGIPWRLAFALQQDGWYLRSDIIWAKPNPMPESVTDRPTKAHEYVFLLTESPRYYYDADAIKEDGSGRSSDLKDYKYDGLVGHETKGGFLAVSDVEWHTRNRRTVWTIATQPVRESHFATFPEKLVEPCILAGTSEKGCCPKCGKPWERVTEPTAARAAQLGKGYHDHSHDISQGMSQDKKMPQPQGGYVTVGWRPGCTCDAGDPVGCVVFDPFAGSGTVECVAIRLRRQSIGTELNYKYISEIVTKRTANIQPEMI